MKKIELDIECPACNGTGVYKGMAEGGFSAVVCKRCDGSGCFHYSYSYSDFYGRKKRDGVSRVYKSGMGYSIGTGKINFSNGIGEIDMDKEGVSYTEFLSGKMPQHIKQLGCPMCADQGACHDIVGFVDRCEELNGGWVGYIPDCQYQPNKRLCWERFERNCK